MKRSLTARGLGALIVGACGGDDADPAGVIEDITAADNAVDIGRQDTDLGMAWRWVRLALRHLTTQVLENVRR